MTTANTTCSGVSHIGISDHSLIYVYRKISSPSVIKGTSTNTYRQFKNFNRNSFRSDILAQPWDHLKGVHNPNELRLKWKTLFLEVSDVIYNNNNSKAFVSAFKILNALTARSENSQSFI